MSNVITLEAILGKNAEELDPTVQGEFKAKVGTILYTSLDQDEFNLISKDAVKYEMADGKKTKAFDTNKFHLLTVVEAVHKDTRSDFTFKNKDLLNKLGVVTATQAVVKMLQPGEISRMSDQIQDDSGFGEAAEEAKVEEVKNY